MEYNKPVAGGSKKRPKASAVLEATKADGEKIEVVGTKLDKHCLSCKHFNKEAVKNCSDKTCLFWKVRPYQTV
jgi:hypothetical protein